MSNLRVQLSFVIFIVIYHSSYRDSNNQPVDTKGAVLTLKILKLEELNSKGVKRKIKEAIIHPEYKFPVHDIAILKVPVNVIVMNAV